MSSCRKSVKNDAKLRDEILIDEALGGKPSPALRRAYAVMLGLSSHDLSAMRELLGLPNKVLFAAQRGGGLYLAATFDYGPFVCQFETGIDGIARFDAHLEVYGSQKVVRIQYDTPYVRNLPIRLFVTEDNGHGGVTDRGFKSGLGRPVRGRMEGVSTRTSRKTSRRRPGRRTLSTTLSFLPKWPG